MIHFDRAALEAQLGIRSLIDRMSWVMSNHPTSPLRQRLSDDAGRELLLMPAMLYNYAGIKALTVIPDNRGTARPVISGLFSLFALDTGEVLATMDAGELTARRTGAVSATAADRLARADASTLVVLGAGHLAPFLAAAHAEVRPIRRIRLWARGAMQVNDAIERTRQLITGSDVPVIEGVSDLEEAVRSADIVSAATRATSGLIEGAWLRQGAHVDLVGGYRPDMREIDDEGICRATLFVDDRAGAKHEAGDLIDPIERGILSADAIRGDLAELCAGAVGRSSEDEITLFKSVGIGIADLIAAIEVWESRAVVIV